MFKRIGTVFLLLCLSLVLIVCKKTPTAPNPDPIVIEKEMLRVTLNASYIVFGQAGIQQNATGTVNFKRTDGTVNKTANIGQQIDLIEVNKGTSKSFNITVTGDRALKRIYKNVILSGTSEINGVTLLKDPVGFGIDEFVNEFLDQCANQNKTWQPSTLTCYIDPSFPIDYKTEIENAINEVAGYSNGAIAAPSFVYEAKSDDDTEPQGAEIWTCDSTRFSGITNYSFGDDIVTASKMWINRDSTAPRRIRNEVFDMFIKNNQNIFINQYIAWHFEFALKHRPKGNQNSYKIYTDREEQDGFDNSVSVMVYR